MGVVGPEPAFVGDGHLVAHSLFAADHRQHPAVGRAPHRRSDGRHQVEPGMLPHVLVEGVDLLPHRSAGLDRHKVLQRHDRRDGGRLHGAGREDRIDLGERSRDLPRHGFHPFGHGVGVPHQIVFPHRREVAGKQRVLHLEEVAGRIGAEEVAVDFAVTHLQVADGAVEQVELRGHPVVLFSQQPVLPLQLLFPIGVESQGEDGVEDQAHEQTRQEIARHIPQQLQKTEAPGLESARFLIVHVLSHCGPFYCILPARRPDRDSSRD